MFLLISIAPNRNTQSFTSRMRLRMYTSQTQAQRSCIRRIWMSLGFNPPFKTIRKCVGYTAHSGGRRLENKHKWAKQKHQISKLVAFISEMFRTCHAQARSHHSMLSNHSPKRDSSPRRRNFQRGIYAYMWIYSMPVSTNAHTSLLILRHPDVRVAYVNKRVYINNREKTAKPFQSSTVVIGHHRWKLQQSRRGGANAVSTIPLHA